MSRFEPIGSVSTWQHNLDFPYEIAQTFLAFALGDPPKGVRIDVQYHDHDSGSYPTLSVFWDESTEEPRAFIRRAEEALAVFNDAVDWSRLHPSNFEEEED